MNVRQTVKVIMPFKEWEITSKIVKELSYEIEIHKIMNVENESGNNVYGIMRAISHCASSLNVKILFIRV